MTVVWSPPLGAAEIRWRTLAHDFAQQAGAEDSLAGLAASGLLRMLVPKRQSGLAASLPAVFGAVEATAADLPRLSTLLASALAAATALLRLGSARQRKAWPGEWIEDGRFPLLVTAGDEDGGDPPFAAMPDTEGWTVRGKGFVTGGPHAPGALVVFAVGPQGRGGQALSAFLLPPGTAGISLEGEHGSETPRRVIRLDVRLAHDHLLGEAGTAQPVFDDIEALRRIAAAAQATGAALTAYEEACRALRDEAASATPAASSRPALKLASCATALSAARMMLYESARAAEAREDTILLSAMAMLSAAECCEHTIAAGLQIAATRPLNAFARLHTLLHARQIHQATAGSAEAQAALLAGAIVPSSKKTQGAPRTMSRNANARGGESSDRVVEILDAAADAFTQQSYDATTLDYIGDAIGVTKGSIYYHYRSKADLFVAVYRRAMEMNIDTVTPISEQPGVRAIDRLYRMVYAHALQVMKHLSYQRVAVQGLEAHLMGRVTEDQRARLNEVIALRDRYEQLFLGALQQAIDGGELPQQSARMAVKPLFGAINWTTMWYQQRPGETAADRDRIAAYLATFVISGLERTYQPLPIEAAEAEST